MNKPPQPITGPPSVPLPAPSPGLTQPPFPAGQPQTVVYTPQMNTSARQCPPGPAEQHSAGCGASPCLPVWLSDDDDPPAAAAVCQFSRRLFHPVRPGTFRTPYMAQTQQYSVPSGTTGFYPNTNPAEYKSSLSVRERRGGGGRSAGRENGRLSLHGAPLTSQRYPAGAYYPAQPQYPPSVPAQPVMLNPAQQPPPPPQQPPPQQQGLSKRERKQIRIRDPNQGGRDITEEIMSGGRTTSTPTPPQVKCWPNIFYVNPVNAPATSTPPPPTQTTEQPSSEQPEVPTSTNASPVPEVETVPCGDLVPIPPGEDPKAIAAASPSPPPAPTSPPPELHVSDCIDGPVPPEAPSAQDELHISLATVGQSPIQDDEVEQEVHEEKQESLDMQPEPILDPITEPALVTVELNVEATPAPSMANGSAEPVKEVEPSPAPLMPPQPDMESTVNKPDEVCLPNGVSQDAEEPHEEKLESVPLAITEPKISEELECTPLVDATPVEEETEIPEETPSSTDSAIADDTTMQGIKGIISDWVGQPPLFFFILKPEVEPVPEPVPPKVELAEPRTATPPVITPDDSEETWEEKEDKLDAENIEPDAPKVEQKYQYKEDQWKPINPEEKKRYDREFLLGFQFIGASMNKPEGLPQISDVVLDKANKTPLRPLDPSRLINCGPDFTPSFANLGRQSSSGRGPPPGPRRSQQGPRKEPRKIIASVSLNDDIQLNKAEKAWKPAVKKQTRSRAAEEDPEDDSEGAKTQDLFRRVRSILNKLTPQMFQQLMKQVSEFTIDTEERLKGVIDLIFEKAISEPNFSVAYANMCRCLMGLKVPTSDKPGVTVNFRKLLLNRCQKEFEKDKDDDEILEQKQKELDAAADEEEKQRLSVELEESKDKARRRSLGNIKFIGELFKLKMLTEPIMHDCIVKLLKNHDEESLECLCRLLSTIGKDLDFEKAKPRMDQYFNQMEKIIKERKTSSRIRFMLQDVLDLRRVNNWVPRRVVDQGPKTIDQIHKEAEMEEHREQIKVQQQLMSKKDTPRPTRGGPHGSGGRGSQPQDEGWNTVPISKNRPIDTSRLSKITKPGALDFNNQLLAPGGKGTWGSWGKGSSGGSGAKPSESGKTMATQNRLDHVYSSSRDRSDRDRVDRERGDRNRFDRFERRDSRDDRSADRNRPTVTKRSFSKESEERSHGADGRGEAVRRVASMTDDRSGRGSRDRSKESVKCEPTPPTATAKPALSEDEVDKKSKAIVEEYLHINDMKEALQCVQELNSTSLLFVFVRNGVESTLERSTIAREHMGLLAHQLVTKGVLPPEQFYKGLHETLELADDMAIDIPHIWLYLAEIITPMLQEGGIPMGQLFKYASFKFQNHCCLLEKLRHKKAGALWVEAGLNWKDFLPEDEDVNQFVTEQNVEFTLREESDQPTKKELTMEDLIKQLDKLIQDKASNQRIHDWVEANLDEHQISSQFVRSLMTSVCQSAIIYENPYKVNVEQITQRAKLLQKYLSDDQKELQALYALQALMVQMEQPANLLRMFFDTLYDEDVIKEEAFYKWESSKDPAEQQGKGVALKSVTAFFTWLREAEEESDNS
uniref:Eukaryotic translation initiation factor 4 gamma 1 n=1 Tax=Denticeps clupeoides TaxID=299321 RepID=A0AAY4AC08_9TELE